MPTGSSPVQCHSVPTATRRRLRTVYATLLGFGILTCIVLPGCGTPPATPPANETPAAKQERLVNEALAIQDQATKLLLGISDQQSAEAAYNGLDQLKSQVVKLVADLKQTGELTPEMKAKIVAEVSRRKTELQQQVGEFTKRLITNPQLLQSLQPVLNKVNEFRQVLDGFLK